MNSPPNPLERQTPSLSSLSGSAPTVEERLAHLPNAPGANVPGHSAQPDTPRLDLPSMLMLSLGHCCVDLGQTAVAALIPFLVASRDYTVGSASLLVLAVTLASSLIQPLFGHVSDRHSLAWAMPAGLILTGAGLALAGISQTHTLTFLAVLAAGIGIAAFHPEGTRYASYASGSGRTTGMSFFTVGGNLGLAIGPALVAPAVLLTGIGLGMTIVGAVPILVGLAYLPAMGRLSSLRNPTQPALDSALGSPAPSRSPRTPADDRWGPFGNLGLVIAVRSTVDFALITFVPLYYVSHLGLSKATGDTAITIMLLAGALGTLLGGRLADRVGRRPVLLGAMGLLTPLLILFHLSAPAPATAILAVAGAVTVATYSVTVVMGQEYLPSHLGVASGVTLGLAIGFGGAIAAVLGLVADSVGVGTVLWGVAGLPMFGLLLTFMLPNSAPALATAATEPGAA